MQPVTLQALTRAIETRDGAALAGFYTDDAVMLIIDRLNPPSQPREIRGRAAVSAYFDDVCGRTMTHTIESGVESDGKIAFTQQCRYPDGKGVFCAASLELAQGRIARQVTVQAWDE